MADLMDTKFQYVDVNGAVGYLTVEEIQKMTSAQFARYGGNLMNVRHDRRHDMGIWDFNTTVVAETHKKTLFRKGLAQQDTTAVSGVEFDKNEIHTNMLKDGEFELDDLVIVTNLEIEFCAFGGRATTRSLGKTTNAKATFPATYDPALVAYTWLSQLWVQYKEGKNVIFEGLAINFLQRTGLFAAFGANAGAYVQNGGSGANLMPNPRVLKGGHDFSVVLTPKADYNLTTATGIDQEIQTKVILETIELIRVR